MMIGSDSDTATWQLSRLPSCLQQAELADRDAQSQSDAQREE
jgi:hypothetical protein